MFLATGRAVASMTAAATLVVSTVLLSPLAPAHAAVAPDTAGSFESSRAAHGEVGLLPRKAPKRLRHTKARRSLEAGLRFRPKVSGWVSGAEVYKSAKPRRRTPRKATLWDASGNKLTSVKIARKRGRGWIDVRFPAPVRVEAGGKYIVSVFVPKGRHPFRKVRRGVSTEVLKAPKKRGVSRRLARSGFPGGGGTAKRRGFLVDVLFVPGTQAPPAPPNPPTPAPPAEFPNAKNTGVPSGTALTPRQGMRITTPGTVVDAQEITGDVTVAAKNVTITRSLIKGSVTVSSSGSLRISDSKIDVGNRPGTGLESRNYVAERVHIVGGNRSAYCASDCTIRDSYVHGQFRDASGTYHESGIRMEQRTTLIHNTIACDAPNVPPDAGCSAGLTGYGDFAPVRDNLIQDNLFLPSTGGACAYGGSSRGKPYSDAAANIRFIGNVFSRGSNGKCGSYFPITDFDRNAPGNVWQDNTWDDGSVLRP